MGLLSSPRVIMVSYPYLAASGSKLIDEGTVTVQKDGKFERKTYPTVAPATYVEYYRIFAKALQGQGEVPVKAEEAADVLRIIELAQESSRTGRTLDFQATLWKPT